MSSPGAISGDWRLFYVRVFALLLVVLTCSGGSFAYSVLTHEEIVDLLWKDEIRPLLLKRYPGLSEDQLKEAHAYAYGGAVIQDLGYYPFGSAEFSNLVHYVRSGDFVRELLLESQDVNEYAFALGALSHYASDIAGHPAVNQAVAIQYPKLRAKFGNSVRYAQGKTAHLKTEFGFDMVQVAKNRYASQQYHDFIGFKVSKSLLERTFPIVYGVELKDVLPREGLAVGSYRFSISRLIPKMLLHYIGCELYEVDKISAADGEIFNRPGTDHDPIGNIVPVYHFDVCVHAHLGIDRSNGKCDVQRLRLANQQVETSYNAGCKSGSRCLQRIGTNG